MCKKLFKIFVYRPGFIVSLFFIYTNINNNIYYLLLLIINIMFLIIIIIIIIIIIVITIINYNFTVL